MRKPIPAAQLNIWRVTHPLEAFWNLAIGTRRGRPHHRLQARREARHVMRQRYMDYARRGRGSKAWRRVEAMANNPAVLVWPNYLR